MIPSPDARIHALELAALDFETTGLDPAAGDRVVEVAVVRGRVGTVPRTFGALVDPERAMAAGDVHGITDAMVRGQPRFAQIADALREALDGAVLVAHNARFDVAFLEMEYGRIGQEPPRVPVIDSLALARRILPLTSHSLASVTAYLGISRDRAHRAEEDAAATWTAAWRLLDIADPSHTLRLDDAIVLGTHRARVDTRVVAAALRAAADRDEPVTIEYRGHARADGLMTTRTIRVLRVTHRQVEAYCHLRNADRVFRLDRIRLV